MTQFLVYVAGYGLQEWKPQNQISKVVFLIFVYVVEHVRVCQTLQQIYMKLLEMTVRHYLLRTSIFILPLYNTSIVFYTRDIVVTCCLWF